MMKYFFIGWKIWKMHTYNFQEINLQKCSGIFCTKVYFAGHTFQCKILISCRDKIWPTLWCIFVHSDSMSLSLSHLLAAFSISIFYCLLYFVSCLSCYTFFVSLSVVPKLGDAELIREQRYRTHPDAGMPTSDWHCWIPVKMPMPY